MIGQLVTSKAGHDKGTLYVIVAVDGDFVSLCDGKTKCLENPKRKRMKHVQWINACVEEELKTKLQNKSKVYAEEIKYALKQYSKQNKLEDSYV